MHPLDPSGNPIPLPDWLIGLFGSTPPVAAAAPNTPAPAVTPDQGAQAVITRYWRWAADGAKTVETGKDAKGDPIFAAVDPDTGQPDPNFPTIAEINAAEGLLTRKQANDPAAVQQAKDQAAATLKETQARTAQIQATLTQKQGPPPSVQPGEGVLNPATGTYDVPIPTKPAGPTKTQAEIDQEAQAATTAAADAHARAVRDAANSRTPEQTAQLELNNSRQLEADRAHNAIEAEKAKIQAQIDAGTLLPADAAAALKEKYDEINANFTSGLRQAEVKYTHDLAQPNLDRDFNLRQQAEQASQQYQQGQLDQADRNQQSGVLEKQAQAGSDFINQGIKLGVTSSMGSVHMALDPLMLALQLSNRAASSGQIPPTAVPTPAAPAPAAASPSAPSAPPPFALSAPAPAIPSERGSLLNYPQGSY